ncbi:MAG: ABC transporter permease [Oscillospiraceae bacterium]|nr:ABC transporter permease [Oscillospiraceae bacterium]
MSTAIYRANFIFWFIQGTVNALLGYICIEFIYGSVESIAGWNKHEMLILIATTHLVGDVRNIICGNQNSFVYGIASGGFDRMIIKPLNLMFQINVNFVNPITLLMGWVLPVSVICVQATHLGTHIGILQILLYVIFIFNGAIVAGSFRLILYSLAFVFVKVDGIDNVTYTINDMAGKPKEIFANKYMRMFFTFLLPVIPIVNAPAGVLLQKCTGVEMLCYLGVGVMFSVLAFVALRLGMRRYNSASS